MRADFRGVIKAGGDRIENAGPEQTIVPTSPSRADFGSGVKIP